MGKEAYITEKLLTMSEEALLIKLADMVYNSYDQPAEKALNRTKLDPSIHKFILSVLRIVLRLPPHPAKRPPVWV